MFKRLAKIVLNVFVKERMELSLDGRFINLLVVQKSYQL